MKIDTSRIYTDDILWNKPIKTYTVLDSDGKKVKIQKKTAANHQSSHPLDQSSTLHYNKGYIITHCDEKVVNPKSNSPKAIENRKKGKVVQYTKKCFIKQMNIPGWDIINDEISVFVLYKNDGENYTLTHKIGVSK